MRQQARMTVSGTNIDCPDAHALADFYRRLLSWDVAQDQPDDVVLSPPGGGPTLSFQTERLYARPTSGCAWTQPVTRSACGSRADRAG